MEGKTKAATECWDLAKYEDLATAVLRSGSDNAGTGCGEEKSACSPVVGTVVIGF